MSWDALGDSVARATVAGSQLAARLAAYAGRADVVVGGVAPCGLPVAGVVAQDLRLPLASVPVQPIRAPANPVLVIGALAAGGLVFLDAPLIRTLGLLDPLVQARVLEARWDLAQHEGADGVPALRWLAPNMTVILVDAGAGTGSTVRAALTALRRLCPARVVIAVPALPTAVQEFLLAAVDELVCLESSNPARAVAAAPVRAVAAPYACCPGAAEASDRPAARGGTQAGYTRGSGAGLGPALLPTFWKAPHRAFGVDELARALAQSANQVRHALTALTAEGLVDGQTAAGETMYQLPQDACVPQMLDDLRWPAQLAGDHGAAGAAPA